MRWLAAATLAALALATIAGGTGFAPSVPVGVSVNISLANLTDLQLCYTFNYSASGPNKSDIDAACAGPLVYLGCGLTGENYLRVGAGGNRTDVFGGDVVANGVHFLYTPLVLQAFRNASEPSFPTCFDASDGEDMCWRLNNATSEILSFGSCAGQQVFSGSVFRSIYSTPCANLTVGAACVQPGGLCVTGSPTCNATGQCGGGTPVVCPPPPPCQVSLGCSPLTGLCETAPAVNGTACNSSNFCFVGAMCQSGACVDIPTPRTCVSSAQCFGPGTCNTTSQQCEYLPMANHTACNDNLNCTTNDQCDGNFTCTGVPVNCTSTGCEINCACNETLNACACDIEPDGTFCTSGFESQCDLGGNCTLGVCVATQFVDCASPSGCFGAGACDDKTGNCVNRTALANGTACSNNNSCIDYACNGAGACNLVISTFPCPAITPCYLPGTRNGTGPTCQCINNFFDGASCPTGDLCVPGLCATGVCTHLPAVMCPGNQCNFPLPSCSILTGCSNPKPNTTPCTAPNGCSAFCNNGACFNPPTCAAAAVAWDLGALLGL
jgi:hypothetical protein